MSGRTFGNQISSVLTPMFTTKHTFFNVGETDSASFEVEDAESGEQILRKSRSFMLVTSKLSGDLK